MRIDRRFLVRVVSRSLAQVAPPIAEGEKAQLTRKEEMKARQLAMAQMLREKAMREVSQSASAVRPAGISHVLSSVAADPVKRLAELRDANQKMASDQEIGGPKGQEPTRFGDWERNGRAFDF